MTRITFTKLAGLMAASLLLSGCEATDPYKREGMWRPEGVVNANLAAQLANPGDLVRGRGDASPVQRQATNAVTRLWTASAALPGPAAGGGEPGGAPK
jgi:type IV pilus biogenesis protein CpaD/CtpE